MTQATTDRVISLRSASDAVRPILEALDAGSEDPAFLNVLPFRTRHDKPAGSVVLRRARDSATLHQVAALQAQRIIALGGRHSTPSQQSVPQRGMT
ncbi:hypothetical protein [Novosphingobium sp. M1R2S20]|uniref:Uncharacterized protein n=1 Tax=Novosphingobium rhizovicinum TaxID=3228928 RepID=A0ABV3RCH7_9SPHN